MPLVLVLCGFASASRARPQPAPPTPAYSPPPREESPFSSPDAFCVPSANHYEGVPPTDPQLRTQPAVVVWFADGDAIAGTQSQIAEIGTFARLVEACGGIGGRPLDVHIVRQSGNPGADCDAAQRLHPVMVVSTAIPPAASCLVQDRRMVLVTRADASNTDLRGSGGRFVASGSSEGVEQARLLGLADSGRLDGRKVAISTSPDAAGAAFRRAALAVMATKGVRVVALRNADAVLEPNLDLATLPELVTSTAPVRRKLALEVYGFDDASPAIPTALNAQPAATAAQLGSVHLHAFSPVSDPSYRAGEEPNAFSTMCNQAVVDEIAKRNGTTTTTSEPQPPLDPSSLSTADVCLLMRIVTRGLFAAGPTLDQRAVITALHRLPFIDQAAPAGTPKPRPNQVVNEPVRRIEQVVVLDQVQSACPPTSTTVTTSTAVSTVVCWQPAPGWDDGGVVVNVPLVPAPGLVSH